MVACYYRREFVRMESACIDRYISVDRLSVLMMAYNIQQSQRRANAHKRLILLGNCHVSDKFFHTVPNHIFKA